MIFIDIAPLVRQDDAGIPDAVVLDRG